MKSQNDLLKIKLRLIMPFSLKNKRQTPPWNRDFADEKIVFLFFFFGGGSELRSTDASTATSRLRISNKPEVPV